VEPPIQIQGPLKAWRIFRDINSVYKNSRKCILEDRLILLVNLNKGPQKSYAGRKSNASDRIEAITLKGEETIFKAKYALYEPTFETFRWVKVFAI